MLGTLEGEEYPQLKSLIVAGEACAVEAADRWAARVPFINAYGPTETTVCASYGVYAGGEASVSIGRPLSNMRLYVLDESLQVTPVGVSGELYVGGVGVARGYLKRAGLSAQRFIADPFSTRGQRLYRTGDRVRYRSMAGSSLWAVWMSR